MRLRPLWRFNDYNTRPILVYDTDLNLPVRWYVGNNSWIQEAGQKETVALPLTPVDGQLFNGLEVAYVYNLADKFWAIYKPPTYVTKSTVLPNTIVVIDSTSATSFNISIDHRANGDAHIVCNGISFDHISFTNGTQKELDVIGGTTDILEKFLVTDPIYSERSFSVVSKLTPTKVHYTVQRINDVFYITSRVILNDTNITVVVMNKTVRDGIAAESTFVAPIIAFDIASNVSLLFQNANRQWYQSWGANTFTFPVGVADAVVVSSGIVYQFSAELGAWLVVEPNSERTQNMNAAVGGKFFQDNYNGQFELYAKVVGADVQLMIRVLPNHYEKFVVVTEGSPIPTTYKLTGGQEVSVNTIADGGSFDITISAVYTGYTIHRQVKRIGNELIATHIENSFRGTSPTDVPRDERADFSDDNSYAKSFAMVDENTNKVLTYHPNLSAGQRFMLGTPVDMAASIIAVGLKSGTATATAGTDIWSYNITDNAWVLQPPILPPDRNVGYTYSYKLKSTKLISKPYLEWDEDETNATLPAHEGAAVGGNAYIFLKPEYVYEISASIMHNDNAQKTSNCKVFIINGLSTSTTQIGSGGQAGYWGTGGRPIVPAVGVAVNATHINIQIALTNLSINAENAVLSSCTLMVRCLGKLNP